jgi:nucleoside-diphosphate-sugar epimerase
MRVFVTGASGAIGSRLVPQLIDAGHEVVGTHHSPASAALLRTLGAKPVLLDLLDARAVRNAVLEAEPEAIVHEATALADVKFSRKMDRVVGTTNELRTTGTDALLGAAREAGVRRFVAQSVAVFSRYAREGGPVKTEDDPVETATPASFRQSAAALDHLEQAVTDFGGIVLRYGGIWSWIHLDDAAAATALAVEHDGPAIYNVVDDDPAPVREWLPVLSQLLGAKPPRHLPVWLARLLAGEFVVVLSTEARGASNAKAKRELGWTARYPSWRTGFSAAYSALLVADRPEPRPAARASHSHG